MNRKPRSLSRFHPGSASPGANANTTAPSAAVVAVASGSKRNRVPTISQVSAPRTIFKPGETVSVLVRFTHFRHEPAIAVFYDGAHVLQFLEHRLRSNVADIAFAQGFETRVLPIRFKGPRIAITINILLVGEPAGQHAGRMVHAVRHRVVRFGQQLANTRNFFARNAGQDRYP